METCVFCDIVAGKAPASIVDEDEVVCADLSIGPVNPGHVLVMPKQHIPFLSDLNEEIGSHLFTITMQMAKALRHSEVQCEGINLFLLTGKRLSARVSCPYACLSSFSMGPFQD